MVQFAKRILPDIRTLLPVPNFPNTVNPTQIVSPSQPVAYCFPSPFPLFYKSKHLLNSCDRYANRNCKELLNPQHFFFYPYEILLIRWILVNFLCMEIGEGISRYVDSVSSTCGSKTVPSVPTCVSEQMGCKLMTAVM